MRGERFTNKPPHHSVNDIFSRADVAMVNETLCKILCHNLVVLIHEIHELGIEPVFWQTAVE